MEGTEEKAKNPPVRIAAGTASIQNGHLPRTRLEGYLCSSMFGQWSEAG